MQLNNFKKTYNRLFPYNGQLPTFWYQWLAFYIIFADRSFQEKERSPSRISSKQPAKFVEVRCWSFIVMNPEKVWIINNFDVFYNSKAKTWKHFQGILKSKIKTKEPPHGPKWDGTGVRWRTRRKGQGARGKGRGSRGTGHHAFLCWPHPTHLVLHNFNQTKKKIPALE